MIKSLLKHFVKLKAFSDVMKHLLGQQLWNWFKYKVQLRQKLNPVDRKQRRVFINWVLEMHENEP